MTAEYHLSPSGKELKLVGLVDHRLWVWKSIVPDRRAVGRPMEGVVREALVPATIKPYTVVAQLKEGGWPAKRK